jgi:LysM repeat protein/ABC-type branched-subunit amino acid transport system substrate-binding protein
MICLSVTYGQYKPAEVTVSQDTVRKAGILFSLHKVEKGQTIFSICSKYGIEKSQLLSDNPELENGLKEGSSILVRRNGESQDRYIKHTVRWYESLQSIANKYNVAEQEIIRINSLAESRVRLRQVLLIPRKNVLPGTPAGETSAKVSPGQKNTNEEIAVSRDIRQEGYVTYRPETGGNIEERVTAPEGALGRTANVALILPFGNPSVESEPSGNNYLDFYQGFLLAVQDMKESGMNLDLKVIDISEYPSGRVLAQSGQLEKCDLIIGPVYPQEVEDVLDFASENEIPLVSPMDPKTGYLAQNNPLFFQIGISPYIQQLNLLKNLSRTGQVILIFEESGADAALVEMSRKILDDMGIRYSSVSYDVLSGREIAPQISSKLSDSRLNEVIVLSNSEAFVSDVLRNLNLLSSRHGYRISLYGTPRWKNFENVDINYYHSMNLHISLQYYVDYSEEKVKNFLERYRSYFSGEPSPYAYQAYDLGCFFLKAFYRFGPRFVRQVEGYTEELLQSDIRFGKERSGFVNNATRLIIYNPDYSIEIRRFDR